MNRFVWLLPVLSLFTFGCGPSASDVCAKLEELDAKPPGCTVKWEVSRSRDKETYEKNAQCVLDATSKEEVQKCR